MPILKNIAKTIDISVIFAGIFVPNIYWHTGQWLFANLHINASPLFLMIIVTVVACCIASLARDWNSQEPHDKIRLTLYIITVLAMVFFLIEASNPAKQISKEDFQPSFITPIIASGFGYTVATLIRILKQGA